MRAYFSSVKTSGSSVTSNLCAGSMACFVLGLIGLCILLYSDLCTLWLRSKAVFLRLLFLCRGGQLQPGFKVEPSLRLAANADLIIEERKQYSLSRLWAQPSGQMRIVRSNYISVPPVYCLFYIFRGLISRRLKPCTLRLEFESFSTRAG